MVIKVAKIKDRNKIAKILEEKGYKMIPTENPRGGYIYVFSDKEYRFNTLDPLSAGREISITVEDFYKKYINKI